MNAFNNCNGIHKPYSSQANPEQHPPKHNNKKIALCYICCIYCTEVNKLSSYFKVANWKEIWQTDRRMLEKCGRKVSRSKGRESWNFCCPLGSCSPGSLVWSHFYRLGFMHLHRILFVILGNLLKPPTRPIHPLGNTVAPPLALSHS